MNVPSRQGRRPGGEGFTSAERLLFRFGLFVGLSEWDLALEGADLALDTAVLSKQALEQALLEATSIKGLPLCMHLRPMLSARGLTCPEDPVAAIRAVRTRELAATAPISTADLTERESFALGLGITWGARCWDT